MLKTVKLNASGKKTQTGERPHVCSCRRNRGRDATRPMKDNGKLIFTEQGNDVNKGINVNPPKPRPHILPPGGFR